MRLCGLVTDLIVGFRDLMQKCLQIKCLTVSVLTIRYFKRNNDILVSLILKEIIFSAKELLIDVNIYLSIYLSIRTSVFPVFFIFIHFNFPPFLMHVYTYSRQY